MGQHMVTRPDWMSSPRHPYLEGQPSTRRGRTDYAAKAREAINVGMHPATRLPLLAADWGFQCGNCIHAVRVQGGARWHWKCARHRLGMSASEASDIRVSWPACTLLTIRQNGDDQ
jgi:hypothetical protein